MYDNCMNLDFTTTCEADDNANNIPNLFARHKRDLSVACDAHLKEFNVADIRVVWLGLMKFNEYDEVIESDEIMLNECCKTNIMTNDIILRKWSIQVAKFILWKVQVSFSIPNSD